MPAFSTLLAFASVNSVYGTGNRSWIELFDNMTVWGQFVLAAVFVTSVWWHFRRERPDK